MRFREIWSAAAGTPLWMVWAKWGRNMKEEEAGSQSAAAVGAVQIFWGREGEPPGEPLHRTKLRFGGSLTLPNKPQANDIAHRGG
ncbi:MAG: hypothetical protein ABIH23_21815 [bacterium]